VQGEDEPLEKKLRTTISINLASESHSSSRLNIGQKNQADKPEAKDFA
jgi:hypothetical protein